MIDALLVGTFALGFLCACALFLALGVWKRGATPIIITQRSDEGGNQTMTVSEPAKVTRKDRPDNEKARRYSTGAYMREKEEAITRGEGYPE